MSAPVNHNMIRGSPAARADALAPIACARHAALW